MRILCGEMLNEGLDVHVRITAGLAAKNALVSKDMERRLLQRDKWKGLERSSKEAIKQLVWE